MLALPIIGLVDSQRGAEMMDAVLRAVEVKQCRFFIIDITGVEVLDTATADRLLKMVSALHLLGARCIMTGTRSAVAQTLISLGAALGSLRTLQILKHGLQECLRIMAEGNRSRVAAHRRARSPKRITKPLRFSHAIRAVNGYLGSCQLNGVDPLVWTTDVIGKLQAGWPLSRLDALLPDAYAKRARVTRGSAPSAAG